MDSSVVIVNWNAGGTILSCLSSIERHPPAGDWEVIVVDNASSDGSTDAIRREAPWVRLVVNRSNVGLAAANNQGILASRGDAIVISNPDVEYREGSLTRLVDVIARRPRAAFAVPRLLHPDGTLQTSAGDLPRLWEAIVGRWFMRRIARPGATTGFCWDAWKHDLERQVGRAGDACFVARREAVVEIGLLDESFPLDWEAIDWSARARAAGWEIWFTPAASVVHRPGTSTTRAGAARWVVATHRGMYRYFRNHRPAAYRPALAVAFTLRAAAKIGAIYAGVPMPERTRKAEAERVSA